MKQKQVVQIDSRLVAAKLVRRIAILAAIAGTVSACELRVGVDYNGKTGVDRTTITPEFRTSKVKY